MNNTRTPKTKVDIFLDGLYQYDLENGITPNIIRIYYRSEQPTMLFESVDFKTVIIGGKKGIKRYFKGNKNKKNYKLKYKEKKSWL